jgi:hypothetical protein
LLAQYRLAGIREARDQRVEDRGRFFRAIAWKLTRTPFSSRIATLERRHSLWGSVSHLQGDLPVGGASGKQTKGRASLVEGQPRGNVRFEAALHKPGEQLYQSFAQPWPPIHLGTEIHTDDRAVPDENAIGRHGRDAAAGKSDDEDPAFVVDHAQALIEHIAADRIQDDVGSAAAGQRLHPFAQALGAVVREFVGTARSCQVEPILAARGCDDARAERLAHLDRRQPGTAGGPGNEQGLPRTQPSAM